MKFTAHKSPSKLQMFQRKDFFNSIDLFGTYAFYEINFSFQYVGHNKKTKGPYYKVYMSSVNSGRHFVGYSDQPSLSFFLAIPELNRTLAYNALLKHGGKPVSEGLLLQIGMECDEYMAAKYSPEICSQYVAMVTFDVSTRNLKIAILDYYKTLGLNEN